LFIRDKDYFLPVISKKILYSYRSEEGTFSLTKSYPCIVGSNNVDKREAGDFATTEGIYFLTSFLMGKALPEKYGSGAFSLMSTFLKKKEKRNGFIMVIPTACPPFSGCIVVKDETERAHRVY
jgi:hypothetical protein